MKMRTRDEIRAAFLDVLAAIAPEVDPAIIAPDKPLREQFDIDSMDFLNIIVRLREMLAIDIPESDYAELATLDRAVDYLVRRCGVG